MSKWDAPEGMIMWDVPRHEPRHKATDEARQAPQSLDGWLSHGVRDDKGRMIGSCVMVYWNAKDHLWYVSVQGGRDGEQFGPYRGQCALHFLVDALNQAQRLANNQARATKRKAAKAAKGAA